MHMPAASCLSFAEREIAACSVLLLELGDTCWRWGFGSAPAPGQEAGRASSTHDSGRLAKLERWLAARFTSACAQVAAAHALEVEAWQEASAALDSAGRFDAVSALELRVLLASLDFLHVPDFDCGRRAPKPRSGTPTGRIVKPTRARMKDSMVSCFGISSGC